MFSDHKREKKIYRKNLILLSLVMVKYMALLITKKLYKEPYSINLFFVQKLIFSIVYNFSCFYPIQFQLNEIELINLWHALHIHKQIRNKGIVKSIENASGTDLMLKYFCYLYVLNDISVIIFVFFLNLPHKLSLFQFF